MKIFKDIVSSYPSIVFLNSKWVGFCILLVSFIQPRIAISGVLGCASAFLFLKLMRIPAYASYRSVYIFNALLVGAFIGDLFVLDFKVLSLLVLAVGFTLLMCVLFNSLFLYSGLPLLSLSFSVVALVLAFASHRVPGLIDASYYTTYHNVFSNEFWNSALQSLGTIFCIPDALFGLSLLLIVSLRSPMTSFFFILGYALGAVVESMLSFGGISDLPTHGFNYALIFTAIAGGFLIPSRFSFMWAVFSTLIGVLISISLMSFLDVFKVPVMALPFNLTVLLVLAVLRYLQPSKLSHSLAATPEAALERSRSLWLRHRTGEIGVFCPFEGEWTVQQGFNGTWTHKGHWQHALDFVVQGKDGKTFNNKGIELSDYHAFDRPVLSPITGIIYKTVSNLEDNPIGKVENQQNWGNFIVIQSSNTLYVTLAHLKKYSIKVAVGDTVTVGQVLAHCGNSGYSQEPHLHMQVQSNPLLGAYTLPFHLLNYRMGKHIEFQKTPKEGDQLIALTLNKVLDRVLSFPLDAKMTWTLSQPHKLAKKVVFEHRLDETTGASYWTDGSSKMFYSKLGSQFYFYGLEGTRWSPLWDLFCAAPRIPMVFEETKLQFDDTLPLYISHKPLRRLFALTKQLLTSKFTPSSAHYEMHTSLLEIQGHVMIGSIYTHTFLKIDPIKGMLQFKVGRRSYVRESKD